MPFFDPLHKRPDYYIRLDLNLKIISINTTYHEHFGDRRGKSPFEIVETNEKEYTKRCLLTVLETKKPRIHYVRAITVDGRQVYAVVLTWYADHGLNSAGWIADISQTARERERRCSNTCQLSVN